MPAKVPVESIGKVLKEYGLAIFLAVILALGFRSFVIEAYRIPNTSMRPTLESGDTVFVTKWDYGQRNPWSGVKLTRGRLPMRGEIVVYSLPTDPTRDSIKRVIAVAGDKVEISKGRIKLNGKSLSPDDSKKTSLCFAESTYQVCTESPFLEEMPATVVPADQVFVLGDSRTLTPEMKRTKNYGLIPMSTVKAKVRWIWLSIEPVSNRGGNWFSRIRFERILQKIE